MNDQYRAIFEMDYRDALRERIQTFIESSKLEDHNLNLDVKHLYDTQPYVR